MSFLSYTFKESENFRILFHESENILKILFPLYDKDSIGVFNFHSGEIMYEIDLSGLKEDIFVKTNVTDIYSISFLNDNYITLSIGKNKIYNTSSSTGLSIEQVNEYYSEYSIQIINLKDEELLEVLSSKSNKNIFVKNIIHPKYGDCLLTQDACGEILLMKINIEP